MPLAELSQRSLMPRAVVVALSLAAAAATLWLQIAAIRGAEGWWIDAARPLTNITYFLASPARICIVKTLGSAAARTTPAIVAANLAMWAALALGLWLTVRLWRVARRPAPVASFAVDQGRRRLLADAVFGLAGVGAAGGVASAALVEPWRLTTRRHRVPIAGLAPALDGLRIAYLSDTHLGPYTPRSAIDAAVLAARGLRPDLYVLGGDYVARGLRNIAEAAEPFRSLVLDSNALGVVGVLGNHDWYENGPGVRAALERIGVTMLDNRSVYLDARRRTLSAHEPGGEALCIAGVGDLDMDAVDIGAALGTVRRDIPRVLLSHNPDVAEDPRLAGENGHRADLMLSGHTHGGQVCFPFVGPLWLPSPHSRKYLADLVQGPACPVVISRGVGMSVMPVRLNCPPEVVEVTLVGARGAKA